MNSETISHYRIQERLGVGGMGEVFKAEDLRLHRPVAIKLLLDELCRDEDAKRRFIQEAQAASLLNHPNIATIYEVDEIEKDGKSCSFIVMEFVPGQTLNQYVQFNELSVRQRLQVVSQIASALAEAHSRNIVHRDIKPSNVMVGRDRRIKVLDFGLAKVRLDLPGGQGAGPMKTIPGTILGTISYMSPEQAMGKEVDHRSDIFSLGVLFYELLTGRLPFHGESSVATLDGILHSIPPSPGRFNPLMTPELERIIYRMLEKDRNRRYQSMREIVEDLGAVLQQFSQLSQTPYSRSSAQDRTLIIPNQLVESSARIMNSRVGKVLAVMTFTNITQNTDDDWLGVGIAETVTADLKNIEGVTVIGRERVHEVLRNFQADRNSGLDEKMATRVGREVGANWIVSGGYQRIGQSLRITARFVVVETGEVIKTVKIDGGMNDIFNLQDKIVYELSQNLQVSLKSVERRVIEQDETEVLPAYEVFSKGMINLRVGSPESLDRAILLFENAIDLDPRYARAYHSLGTAYELKALFLAQPALYERATANYQKAIELQPQMAESYRGLGMVFLYQGKEDEAIGAIKRTLSFASKDPGTHAALARAYFIGKGQFREAAEEYEKALKLNPQAGWVSLQLAYCYALMGETERAEQAARQTIALQEQYLSGKEGMQIIGAYSRLGYIFYLQGRYDEAAAQFRRELEFLQQADHALRKRALIEVHQRLGSALLRGGNPEPAREAFDRALADFRARLEIGADDPYTRYYVACAYAMTGDRDKALESLEKAVRGCRHFTIQRAKKERDFESLRGDPGFQALLAE